MAKYRTIEGQTLDQIAWSYYGDVLGSVEAILEANPGLASHGPTLPGGLVIELPNYNPPKPNKGVRLWD